MNIVLKGVTSTLFLLVVFASSNAVAAEPAKNAEEGKPVVSFQGTEVADDWAIVAKSLIDKKLAPPHLSVPVPEKGSLCQVYRDTLNLPGCTAKVIALAEWLNRGMKPPRPYAGEKVIVPDLPLTPFRWARAFDLDLPEDRLAFKDFQKRWESYQKEIQERRGQTRIVVRGWQLELPVMSADDYPIVTDAWGKLDIPHANFSLPSQFSKDIRFSGTAVRDPGEYFSQCRENRASANEKGSYSMILGVPKLPECECEPNCPEIVLIDTHVYKHPDLANALIDDIEGDDIEGDDIEGDDDAQAEQPGIHCPTTDFSEKKHHGTHMAGIMVSQNHADSHFLGLAQNARLRSYPWDRNFFTLRNFLFDRAGSVTPQVFVFASKFSYQQVGDEVLSGDTHELKDTEVRKTHPLPVKTILDENILWISAAGHNDNQVGDHIGRQSLLSPMNLGDQRNVIVVTACEECFGQNAKLWPNAYYSTEGLVNVAAPGGKPIPSTATNRSYAITPGTSQATAFVGGIAAQMMACFPTVYQKPYFLKEWLQVTARPFPKPQDNTRVTGGIVDPEAAFLDPQLHWLTDAESDRAQLASLDWLVSEVKLSHADSAGAQIIGKPETRRIHRILKVHSTPSGNDQWLVYVRTDRGKVEKIGPGVWNDDREFVKANLTDGSQKILSFREIDDLIVKITSD